jgi:hypothetical protein
VLYGRAGCHLCAQARTVVTGVCAEFGEVPFEVDIDTAGDPALLRRWTDHVPVVTVDGAVLDVFRVDPVRLAAALRHS